MVGARWSQKDDGWHPCDENDEEMGFALIINGLRVATLEGTQIEDEEYNGQYKLWLADNLCGEYFDVAKTRADAWKKLQKVINEWPIEGYEHLSIKREAPAVAKDKKEREK